ncbi:MAG: hypothetical protein ACRD2H_09840 [Terriglobales bacterium]
MRLSRCGSRRGPAALRSALLCGAVLMLLLAPISQAADRHDRFSPRDLELNVSALAVLATAGYWAYRKFAPAPAESPLPNPTAPAAASSLRAAAGARQLILSPPSPPSLLRV